MKIGITGQSGFVGTHLYNYLNLDPDRNCLISFYDSFFDDPELLTSWVAKCDVIVHLAAMNRHSDPDFLYRTNIELTRKLIFSLENSNSKAHVLFSSSVQEAYDNPYGRSKKEGRELLAHWSEQSGGKFTGLLIPNVFGPFGQPNYNSVVATFCYQLTHGEAPVVINDQEISLIYIDELTRVITEQISSCHTDNELIISPSYKISVTGILELLQNYRETYGEKGVIPVLQNTFETNLFNTFRSYLQLPEHFPVSLSLHEDERGSFVELIRLGLGGQVSFSTTKPGVTRGNHFHTRKIERFAVIRGKAIIRLRRIGTKEVLVFHLDGSAPSYVDMPVWYTHSITNVGNDELFTVFWINEFYDPDDPDTYFETV